MSKILVKPTSRKDIWSFVRKVRCVFGVESKLYFDIVGFVERVLPEIFPDFVLEICPEEEMGNRHGETIPSESKIRIREDVYIGACEGKGRDRFTIAHEVGHFFMHDEQSVVFFKLNSKEKLLNFYDSDWQADVFAGELLAPSYLISEMSGKEISDDCAVTEACANRQLYAIDCERNKGFAIIPV